MIEIPTPKPPAWLVSITHVLHTSLIIFIFHRLQQLDNLTVHNIEGEIMPVACITLRKRQHPFCVDYVIGGPPLLFILILVSGSKLVGCKCCVVKKFGVEVELRAAIEIWQMAQDFDGVIVSEMLAGFRCEALPAPGGRHFEVARIVMQCREKFVEVKKNSSYLLRSMCRLSF